MRTILLGAAVSALAFASPAAVMAQEAVPDDHAMETLADKLSDPAEQERLTGMVEAMSHVLLSMPVAPLMEAMAEATGGEPGEVDPDATLGELAGPGAERVPEEIADKLPQMMEMMAGMAKSFESLKPMLESMSDVIKAEVEQLPED